ncbi:PqqD family protein [bacterium]|nr:PqqD family protein [bacterium]
MQYQYSAEVNRKSYPRRNDDLVWRDIAGEVVIADRSNGTIRVLNNTASVFWTLSDGSRNISEIVSSICQNYEVSQEESTRDSLEFCQILAKEGLVSISDITF